MDLEIDSYSGFYDNGYTKSTGLAGYLRAKKVKEIYLTGLAGDFCVYFTAMDALKEEFDVLIILDAVCALNQRNYENLLNAFITSGGKTIHSKQVCI